jgi:hypothetical protein
MKGTVPDIWRYINAFIIIDHTLNALFGFALSIHGNFMYNITYIFKHIIVHR